MRSVINKYISDELITANKNSFRKFESVCVNLASLFQVHTLFIRYSWVINGPIRMGRSNIISSTLV